MNKRTISEEILFESINGVLTWGELKQIIKNSEKKVLDTDKFEMNEYGEILIERLREETDEEYTIRKTEANRVLEIYRKSEERAEKELYEKLKKKYER